MALMLVLAVIFVGGCTEKEASETKYVCPDGSVVSDTSLCNAEKNETIETGVTESENVLKIVNNTRSLSPDGNYLYISGIVENHGSCVANFVKVKVKFYKEKQVIEQYFESVDSPYINAGKTSDFHIMLHPLDYDYYTLVTYGECLEETVYSEELVIEK